MNGLHIVPMEERHLAALTEIEKACFSAPWSEQALRDELGGGIFLVAEVNGAAAGYIGCQTALDEGYITDVAVLPALRRRGVGRELVGALAAYARERGLSFVTLEARASNGPALALYRQMGFTPVGTRKNFYAGPAEDAVLMTRFLKEQTEWN